MNRRVVSLLMAVACSACVANPPGKVAMNLQGGESHISLGSKEVSVGDKVGVFRNECEKRGKKSSCSERLVGEGVVTAVLSDRYSAAKFPSGVEVREGDAVKKIP